MVVLLHAAVRGRLEFARTLVEERVTTTDALASSDTAGKPTRINGRASIRLCPMTTMIVTAFLLFLYSSVVIVLVVVIIAL